MMPSPVVEVNRAVAVAMADGPAAGLELLHQIDGVEAFYPYHVARAELLRRTNQLEAAADAYERALALCQNSAERAYLQRRLDQLIVSKTLFLSYSHAKQEEMMTQEYIEIRGARENNLKNVSLRIPRHKITIFTGVSGSGKSSIVFDTIATEAQRQLYETFSMFVRNFLPRYSQPDADSIENLGMAIVVDQKRLGGGSHSTMGTITDIYTVLRLLFSRVGEPFAGYSNVFSFNDPQGMCPECNGLGRKLQPIVEKFYDPSKSLNEGALQGPIFDASIYAASGFFDNDKKLSEFTQEEMDLLLYGEEQKFKLDKMTRTYRGVITNFTRSYIERDLKTRSERTQEKIAQYLTEGPCPACKGARLNQAVLNCKINGYNIAELSSMEVGELIDVIKGIKGAVAKPMVDNLVDRLQNVVDIGLDYLTLNRETDTLSGGEAQRVKMVKQMNSSLIDVMYIFDEPSVGLHPRDVHRLNEMLLEAARQGQYGAGSRARPRRDQGGRPHCGYRSARRQPGRRDRLRRQLCRPARGGYADRQIYEGGHADQKGVPPGQEYLKLSKVNVNNLKNVSVNIPVGVLTLVTGVAGSGKSSLINEAFVSAIPRRHRDRPIRGGCVFALQPGHVHRHHGRCAQGFRQSQSGRRGLCSVSTPRVLARTARAWAWCTLTFPSSRV